MKKTRFPISMMTLLLISLLTSFAIETGKAEPRIWIVDDDGPADFSTIQDAVDAGREGDTVYVMPGTYYGRVLVDKPMSLFGESKETPIIDASGDIGICVITDGCRVQGFEVVAAHIGVYVSYCSDNVVSDNCILNAELYGIYLNRASRNLVNLNLISECGADGIFIEEGHENHVFCNEK